MRKYFCDCCGKEVTYKNLTKIDIPCHLYSFAGKSGYADTDGNQVSGRQDTVEACNRCLNDAYHPMVKKIREIQKRNKLS